MGERSGLPSTGIPNANTGIAATGHDALAVRAERQTIYFTARVQRGVGSFFERLEIPNMDLRPLMCQEPLAIRAE